MNLYIPSKPYWRVSFALNQLSCLFNVENLALQPNMPVLVDLRYNYVLDRFIVFDACKRNNTTPLPTDVNNKEFVSLPVNHCLITYDFFSMLVNLAQSKNAMVAFY